MADLIDELAGMDDAALGAKLGFNDKVSNFRADLKRAQALSGKPREKVESHLKSMFTPHVYTEDLKWRVDDAERLAKGKTSPCSIVQEAGCDCPVD